jgi:hypothetical protein
METHRCRQWLQIAARAVRASHPRVDAKSTPGFQNRGTSIVLVIASLRAHDQVVNQHVVFSEALRRTQVPAVLQTKGAAPPSGTWCGQGDGSAPTTTPARTRSSPFGIWGKHTIGTPAEGSCEAVFFLREPIGRPKRCDTNTCTSLRDHHDGRRDKDVITHIGWRKPRDHHQHHRIFSSRKAGSRTRYESEQRSGRVANRGATMQ